GRDHLAADAGSLRGRAGLAEPLRRGGAARGRCPLRIARGRGARGLLRRSGRASRREVQGRGSDWVPDPGQRRRTGLEGRQRRGGRAPRPGRAVRCEGRGGGCRAQAPGGARGKLTGRPMRKTTPEEALEYHARGRKGKVEVVPSKPCRTQEDLSLAYSPGVAEPCLAIAKDPDKVYEYTSKGNLVAVISNGTAVLGLGDIGPLASKPVMEGKGVLFKRFADIDVFDIEVDALGVDEFVGPVARISAPVGGINLEDVKSPECFEIEERLKKRLQIPVFHDDQHGTAIISAAAFLNALDVVGKKIEDVKVVFCG